MPATVTLATTNLAETVDASTPLIKVASVSGIYKGIKLWVDRELMAVVSLGVEGKYPTVNVLRGQGASAAAAHSAGATITIGTADQFYMSDPVGAPPQVIPVSPWINTVTGTMWLAQGDAVPIGSPRWWQQITTTYGIGALGVRTTSQDPSTST